jgi:DNA-binding response OmpR family regulator
MNAALESFAVLVTQPGTAERHHHEFVGEIVVGRAEECDIVLANAVVSRRQAVIALYGGEFRVRDLGSRNGTVVNGQRCLDVELRAPPGAIVQIGPFQLALSVPGATPDATTVLAAQTLNARCYLDVGLRTFYVDGIAVIQGVAGREYALLERLVRAAPNVVPNHALADSIWGEGQWDVYMLHNLVRRVRRKIAEVTAVEAIVTVPGAGYRVV